MDYKAVYTEEATNGHRAFIARRRGLRLSEEYKLDARRRYGWQSLVRRSGMSQL